MREKGAVLPLLLGIPAGMLFGLAVFTFGYARGGSYMTDDPQACANCHVMNEQYAGWMKSSHRNAAVCNDCHTPPGFVPKYFTKALNGFNHSLAFTTGHFPEIIQITKRNKAVTQASCMKCHEEITQGIGTGRHGNEAVSCTQCHQNVGHSH
jgi:cytochrome c nitrite reductase small subunit